MAVDRPSSRTLSFQLGGGEGRKARVCLMPEGSRHLPRISVMTASGDQIEPHKTDSRHVVCDVPAHGRVTLSW
ncbi:MULTISPECIES: hypothetical protein [unclassified Novosphingobium]|uniref:hypothetical protein n=1 Tax=unclassified Novosphingobium TaxID=2644732 RepID=UPI0025DAA1A7|nr:MULTISPECIES: hypothetical protein [unclassified Novosphingobium]HQS68389.1 hypothetical protein [Novosphingobium sp.]